MTEVAFVLSERGAEFTEKAEVDAPDTLSCFGMFLKFQPLFAP